MRYMQVCLVAVLFLVSCQDCGNLQEGERDTCCASMNKDTATSACIGSWKYSDGACTFACDSFPEDGTYNITYAEGLLSYSLVVEKPTPCHTLELRKSRLGTVPPQVSIDVMFVASDKVCAQVISPQKVTGTMKTDKPGIVIVRVAKAVKYQKIFN
ncbi:MAG: hypothetical protein HGA85_06430 [Nanoarchaeota archaeon]|nr:hypothetical protein [Nanoarchaeota archaeon]